MRGAPVVIPYRSGSRRSRNRRAAWASVRTGTGPSCAAIPPKCRRVASVVRAPSSAARIAAIVPAGPAPMTSTFTTPFPASSGRIRRSSAPNHFLRCARLMIQPTHDPPRRFAMSVADWTKPAALAIPKEGYFKREDGRYGPLYPKTPANYGFTIIAKVKSGQEETVRAYGKKIEDTIAGLPDGLAILKLHYLRWVLLEIKGDTYFMYQGIFDTDFDKYTEDAVALFSKYGINTVFENLEDFPTDWRTNVPAFVKFVRDHQCPSFLEYAEYPYVSAREIKKALKLKAAFSDALDQMQ